MYLSTKIDGYAVDAWVITQATENFLVLLKEDTCILKLDLKLGKVCRADFEISTGVLASWPVGTTLGESGFALPPNLAWLKLTGSDKLIDVELFAGSPQKTAHGDQRSR